MGKAIETDVFREVRERLFREGYIEEEGARVFTNGGRVFLAVWDTTQGDWLFTEVSQVGEAYYASELQESKDLR